jgi:hypothetical protein
MRTDPPSIALTPLPRTPGAAHVMVNLSIAGGTEPFRFVMSTEPFLEVVAVGSPLNRERSVLIELPAASVASDVVQGFALVLAVTDSSGVEVKLTSRLEFEVATASVFSRVINTIRCAR